MKALEWNCPVRIRMPLALGLLGWILGAAPPALADSIGLFLDQTVPQLDLAAQDLRESLTLRGHAVSWSTLDRMTQSRAAVRIVLTTTNDAAALRQLRAGGGRPPASLRSEGYSLRRTSQAGTATYWGIGADAAGTMYAGLDLGELIRVGGLESIQEADQNPCLRMRGTKFNCPLDVRTPSYTDVCDAAQQNIAEMWNFDFWRDYLDQLARCRYNFVSLWSLHPFPSLVQLPDYPDIALADVQRSTTQWKEFYSLNGIGFDSPDILENVETLKKMSIDEKIDFWRKVMRYGKERHVDFYFVTWNIFVHGTGGKYGITDDINNPATRDYFRQSVRQMFLTYPDLKGIGLTTGENIPGASFQQKEDWALATYGQGVLDAARARPGRKITFIHRQHQTGAKDIARTFAPLIDHPDIEFIFSFKYAKAHVYSATTQPYHQGFVRDIQEEGDLKTIWTLRNDDVYYYRWGAPDFVREFIENIPHSVSRGFYFGSDQYVWGREFLSKEPESPRELEIIKHWYHWMLWGRLGYDPKLSNERFIRILQQRYPEVSGHDLFTAWQEASLIYPKTTGFHWGSLDFQWYIEGCKSHPGFAKTQSGFHDVNRFITLKPHPGTDNISIPDYVQSVQKGQTVKGTTPGTISAQLHAHAEKALDLLAGLNPGGSKELRLVLADIRTMAYLGKYYAHKIHGATELALFRKTGEPGHQATAVQELTDAARFWRLYAATALGQYQNPLWMNRVGHCDWRKLFAEVLHDIEIAGGQPQSSSLSPTPGGLILEAENARFAGAQTAANCDGFTGTGYLELGVPGPTPSIEWSFQAPESRTYCLELRYACDSKPKTARIRVNGQDAEALILWHSGGRSTWAWDRLRVRLDKGENTIRFFPTGARLVDHLNVL